MLVPNVQWKSWAINTEESHAAAVFVLVGVPIWLAGEIGNGVAHLALRDQKGPRSWPKGAMFSHVSCPHYLFEIISWIGWAVVTGVNTAAPVVYAVVASAILVSYGLERHWAYQRKYKDYPVGRKAVVPFVV